MSRAHTYAGLIVLAIGVAVSIVAGPLIGRTAAIAMPDAFPEWFWANASLEASVLLWDTLVVYGLGAGILLFGATLTAAWAFKRGILFTATLVAAGFLIGAHVLIPALYGTPFFIARPWWGLGLELSTCLAVGAAALVALALSLNVDSSGCAGQALR